MYFCEPCRVKKNWPESITRDRERCEQCGKPAECHDVPSVMLIPDSERTTEQKLVLQIVQQGFKERAEGLIITHLDGRVDNTMTDMLRKLFVKRGLEIDWYATFCTRQRVQEGHLAAARVIRDRRLT